MDCHFRDLPDFQSSNARLKTNWWHIPKMTVHKKLLIQYIKVLNQIWWSWCYYNEEKMLYPARWKKITVDQIKVLKISFLVEDHPACDDVTSEVYRNTFRTTIIILLPTLLCFILQTFTVLYPAFICYINTKMIKRLNIKLKIGEQYLSSCIIIVSVFVQNSVLNHENRNATYILMNWHHY